MKNKIKKLIEDSFKGVTLDGGLSLEQTKVIDNYGRDCTAEQFANLPDKEITNDWQKIPKSVLDGADCIAHLDEKGFKYYIPAFMLRVLESYDSTSMMTIGTLSSLYPKEKSREYLYSELDDQQRQVIAIYLKNLPDLLNLEIEDKTTVARALHDYWSKFLSPEIN